MSVHFNEAATPGRWWCRAGRHYVECYVDRGRWVVLVDGVEQFTAASLQRAEREVEDRLAP
ncbi:MAG TPA: hypothetical protein VJM33_13835 [Microthrixaceae bacterium]|nr:hypothetical protein [Microthrixaceae bacterium]